jgi:predicted dehydrogenase/threonine dehydrogenase-like Zn-dependent dehydrogenase
MPRPAVRAGQVLVRARYSLISAGTEVAALTPASSSGRLTGSDFWEKSEAARRLLAKAMRDPRKAVWRVEAIARGRVMRAFPRSRPAPPLTLMGELIWSPSSAATLKIGPGGSLLLTRDTVPNAYQALSEPTEVPDGYAPAVRVRGEVEGCAVLVGLLDRDRANWVGHVVVGPGSVDDRFVFPTGEPSVTLVLANTDRSGRGMVRLDEITLELLPPAADGGPASDMDHQGWNVGYSLSGEVVAVGTGVDDIRPGDLVACAGAGFANHAEYVSVPRNLVCPVPVGTDLRVAATTTVGTIALQGVRRARPELGDRVCVVGLGLIGQLTVQLLLANGCVVAGYDTDASRVERARAAGMQAGSDDPEALKRLVLERTAGQGADQTIVAAGTKSNETVNLAMELTRRKGRVVVVGDVGLGVERAAFYRKEIDLLISTSYGPGRYDRLYEEEGIDYPYGYVRWTLNRNMQAYLEQVANGRLDISSLIDLVVPLADAPKAYETLRARGQRPLGVLIEYPQPQEAAAGEPEGTSITLRGHAMARPGKVRYAVVGAGAFATSMLVPRLGEDGRFSLAGVVSRDAVRGGNLARSNRAEFLATDLAEVLKREDLDLLVIATRHRDHATQALAGLKAGKHVFVEKPLALTWEELDEIVATHSSFANPPLLMVGYNRRFSPALRTVHEELAGRRSPMVINYRVNAGFIPLDSWIQGQEGGGRNLGEACHMYDVFRWLTGAPVEAISASSIRSLPGTYLPTDNFVATINYGDGSVATLTYTSLGPKQGLPKERIEVFCGGQAYLVDDFRRAERCADNALLWSGDVDKGHTEEMRQLGDALTSGGPAPVPFEEIVEASVVALSVEDLLREGEG